MRRLERTRRKVVSGVVLLAWLLSACQSEAGGGSGDRPDPSPIAAAVAAALAAGDLSGVAWSSDPAEAQESYDAIVAGLGELVAEVAVAEAPETSGAAGSATLTWTWPVGGRGWSYDTRAELTLVEGAWRVVWDPSLVEPSLRGKVVLDAATLPARRGDVVGAGGVRLVTARPVRRIGIDRTLVPPARAAESARRLAVLLDLDVRAYVERVATAGDRAFVEAILLRADDVTAQLDGGIASIEGARAVSDAVPLAPTAEFAAPLLGRVGEVTAEMIEEDPDRYQVGDVAGLSGLQARYDEQLAGTAGFVIQAVATDGKAREVFRVDGIDGDPLLLTLDARLQRQAERLLAGVAPASALIALRPSTGEVLVAANGPGTAGVNVATYGQAAPGSTFKTVSSLALLRAGLTPDSPVPCSPSIVVDGKSFTNYDDYPPGGLGSIPLRTALANSCNTAFISQAEQVGRSDLAEAAASLGLGIDHDLGFPAYFGQVEPAASRTEAAASLIGQGTILASPLVMATVMASVQSGGTVVPHLVRGVESEVPAAAPPLTPAEAAALRAMLRGVVTSGSGSQLLDVPGAPVLAKTGTAEFDRDGARLTHAWMVAAQGDLAVAVYVDVGESGSATAGPILEAFLRAAA